ncbi:MAG: hypothetical protein NTV05_12330 [Acidobacteria bacterium]|nr:hypothetical protein [Acidobacteriota bacterium]
MSHVEVLVPVALFAMIGWIVYIAVTAGRRKEQLKTTAEFHAKVLDKMGSAKDFGEFLETDGGKRFMSSLTVDGPSAKTRIVGCAERAVLCLSIGIGFLLLGSWFDDYRDGMIVMGTIITACGVGSLISCVSSYFLSKNFGLFEPPASPKP